MLAFRSSLTLSVALLSALPAVAGPKVYVGLKSPPSQVGFDQVEHTLLDQLLTKYVDADGFVNYRAWKHSATDSAKLDQYLDQLSRADLRTKAAREAKLAFWINAYNALTIRGILREYPTDSIRNHTARLYGYNMWHDLLLFVGGTPVTLHAMEHQILRKMNEPRIHFAIVCASVSCPRLLNRAYASDRLEQQLEQNTRDFFGRPQNFRFSANRLYFSAILKWYGDDFGSSRAEQLKTYSQWLPSEAAKRTAVSGTARIVYLDYNWSLNEQPADTLAPAD